MTFSNQWRQELRDALIAAYPDRTSLREMLYYQLNINLDEIAGGGNLREVVFNLIIRANAEGWVEPLIKAALIGNPENPEILQFALDNHPEILQSVLDNHPEILQSVLDNRPEILQYLSDNRPYITPITNPEVDRDPINPNPTSNLLKDIGGTLLCIGGLGLIFFGVGTKTVVTTSSLGCFCVIGAVIIFVRDSPI